MLSAGVLIAGYCMLVVMLHKLFVIKFIHSLIFWWQVVCLSYLLYAGVSGTFGVLMWLAIASIVVNGILLLLNKGRCPLTNLAED